MKPLKLLSKELLVWSGADAYIKTLAYPQYPRVVTVRDIPLYIFIKSKIDQSREYRVDRLEHGLPDTIETQHFNIIWLVKRYNRPTPLLCREIASTVLRCIYRMFAAVRYTYKGRWIYSDFNAYTYTKLRLLMDCTITYDMTHLLNINRYDPTGFDAISPPPPPI